MAAFGLIHVVRGDEECEPLGGEDVDVFPKIAPRLWVHAGGWLVEQQEFWLMDEARGEREALLPSAGKLTG